MKLKVNAPHFIMLLSDFQDQHQNLLRLSKKTYRLGILISFIFVSLILICLKYSFVSMNSDYTEFHNLNQYTNITK